MKNHKMEYNVTSLGIDYILFYFFFCGISIIKYLLAIKGMKFWDSGKLLYNTESSAQCSVTTKRSAVWVGRDVQEGGDIFVCILMADSCCCITETNTTL